MTSPLWQACSVAPRQILTVIHDLGNSITIAPRSFVIMDMKYITVKTAGDSPELIPFIFPRSVNHDAMYEGVRTAFISQDWIRCTVVSAGFVDMETMRCHGRSETLNLKPAKGDTALLRATYGGPKS
ncbi:MAG: hypothetical protein ABJN42_21630 [Roseibium sp.]|uniref:hypothetical protein n=1 Tax=Roseibium sp. TaxID=1936156 RepID=UPI003296A5F3